MSLPADGPVGNDVGPAKLKGRLDYIDVLRALAVLSVVSVHVWSYWVPDPARVDKGSSPSALIFRVASLGSWGVDLFIVISGFCLAHPLFKHTERAAPPRDLRISRFYSARLADPPGLLRGRGALLRHRARPEGAPVPGGTTRHRVGPGLAPPPGADVVRHDDRCHQRPVLVDRARGPAVPRLPLLLLLIRRWGFGRALATTVAVAVVWAALGALWNGTTLSHTFGADLSKELPARWFEFALGVLAARLVTAPRRSDLRLGIAAMCIGLPVALVGESINSDLSRAVGYGGLAFGLVLTCAFLPHRVVSGNPVGRTVQKLGVISFSFYLIHQPVLLLLAPAVRRIHVGSLGGSSSA